jgi:hypothetical protein
MPARKPRGGGEQFVADAVPAKIPGTGGNGSVAKIPEASMDKIRVCIRAARLRAQHRTYRQIAVELGLPSPREAYDAVQTGLSAHPAEDVRSGRRLAEMRFDHLGGEALAVIRDPGPAFSQGKVMVNEATGEPYPDNGVRVAAMELLRKLQADWRKFNGLDAPKRSVHLTGDISDLQARAAELRAELGIEGDGDPGGPPALTGSVVPG